MRDMMRFIYIFSCLFIFSVLFVRCAEAAGIAVSPSRVEASVAVKSGGTKTITVTNPSASVALFEAYPEEFNDVIELIPSSFVLEAGEKREVVARFRPLETGVFATALSVTAKPLSESVLRAGAGVRVPVLLRVEKGRGLFASLVFHKGTWGVVFIVFFIVLGFVYPYARSFLTARNEA